VQTNDINDRKLDQLRMLADWQLSNLGYDPADITARCAALDAKRGR
jgi:hypothetical protein